MLFQDIEVNFRIPKLTLKVLKPTHKNNSIMINERLYNWLLNYVVLLFIYRCTYIYTYVGRLPPGGVEVIWRTPAGVMFGICEAAGAREAGLLGCVNIWREPREDPRDMTDAVWVCLYQLTRTTTRCGLRQGVAI